MELGLKDIGRIIGAVILVAILLFLYYDRKKTLRHKLNGRDRQTVLAEQVAMVKAQAEAMYGVMCAYLAFFKHQSVCDCRTVYAGVAPVYEGVYAQTEQKSYIEELFDEETLNLAGKCQRIFNDFGFQSHFYDLIAHYSDTAAPPFADECVKPAYQAFSSFFDVTKPLEILPEKYAKLEKLARAFEQARHKLFGRLDKKYGPAR